MTIATEIATRGSWESTDISNMVTEAFDDLSLFAGETITEGSSTDWDRIAKLYAIRLLNVMTLQVKAISDHSIVVPEAMTEEIRALINKLIDEPDSANPSTTMISEITSPTSKGLEWYSP